MSAVSNLNTLTAGIALRIGGAGVRPSANRTKDDITAVSVKQRKANRLSRPSFRAREASLVRDQRTDTNSG